MATLGSLRPLSSSSVSLYEEAPRPPSASRPFPIGAELPTTLAVALEPTTGPQGFASPEPKAPRGIRRRTGVRGATQPRGPDPADVSGGRGSAFFFPRPWFSGLNSG